MLASAGVALWMMGSPAVGATGAEGLVAQPAPALPAVDLGDPERQQRMRELRRQLLEHSRSWRGDAALRRSAAIPEPTDTPAVVADKILPLTPGVGVPVSPVAVPAEVLQPAASTLPSQVSTALPVTPSDTAPALLVAPSAPVLPMNYAQDPATGQAASPLKASSPLNQSGPVADAVTDPDPRLSERERRQLRQQLRQVLRLQEPRSNP